MTKAETKREIQALFSGWPERAKWKNAEAAAPAFCGWLEANHASLMSYGEFGPGDRDQVKYHVIKGWCDEWEWNHRANR